MSISVNEVNYLIWRYLQESGLEVSAFALDDETSVNKLDSDYASHVPLGCLVDLIQKGILYSKMSDLVACAKSDSLSQDDMINLNFNFFTAMHEINKNDSTANRKIVSSDLNDESQRNSLPEIQTEGQETTNSIQKTTETLKKDNIQTQTQTQTQLQPLPQDSADEHHFIKVIKESFEYESSYSVSFCPTNSSILAWSQQNHKSIIYSFETDSKYQLTLPLTCKETLLISWSPTGSYLITASENGELRLWSNSGTLINTLAMHHWPIVSVNWSPTGKYILSLDIRNVVIVWNAATASVVLHLDKDSWSHLDKNLNELMNNVDSSITEVNHKNYGTDVCWLDDNKFVIPGPNHKLLVCQVTNEENNNNKNIIGILTGHEESICCVKYNPILRLLCSASEDAVIRIWKGNSTNSLQILTGHSLAISMLEWINIAGKWYLLSTSLDGTIRIWDFVQNELIALENADEGQALLCGAVYCSEDEKNEIYLATGDSSGSVCVWRIERDPKNTIKIRQIGLYQHYGSDGEGSTEEGEKNRGFASQISWSKDGTRLAVSFNVGKSVVISVP